MSLSHTLQDPRAYLQRRVAMFAAVASVTFAVLAAIDLATPNAQGEATFSSTRVASLAVSVTCAGIWLPTRRGGRSARHSRALELLGMTVAMGVFATLLAEAHAMGLVHRDVRPDNSCCAGAG